MYLIKSDGQGHSKAIGQRLTFMNIHNLLPYGHSPQKVHNQLHFSHSS